MMPARTLLIAAAVASCSSFGQHLVPQRIVALGNANTTFAPVSLLSLEAPTAKNTALWRAACRSADVLRYDEDAANAILAAQPPFIALEVPTSTGTLTLDIERADILADGFVVRRSSDERVVEVPTAVHYQGMIRGDGTSLVAISIFEHELMGIIADDDGQRVIGRFVRGPQGLHVLYNDRDLVQSNAFTCGTLMQPHHNEPVGEVQEVGDRTTRCVRLFWEAAYDIYQSKGSVANTVNYLTGLFNQASVLYANDGISVSLQETYVWNTPSPYNGGSSNSRLNQFGITRTSFNGDLAHLLDYGGYGGLAWLNTLCSSTSSRMAYSGIGSSYDIIPLYSWSVNVVAHEQGHNMGSSHTHDCVWNGNSTAIDGCGPTAGYGSSPGGCSQAALPAGGGTVMSYCHLVAGTGINLNMGFGAQPAQLIRNNIEAASCLSGCGSLLTNDACANAILIGCDSLVFGTTVNASADSPPTCITGLSGSPGVWYKVVGSGYTMVASLCGSGFNTRIGVFSGTCGSLVCVTGNDDDQGPGGADLCGGGVQSSTSWASTAGSTYYILVTGQSSAAKGIFNLSVACSCFSPTPACTPTSFNGSAGYGLTVNRVVFAAIDNSTSQATNYPYTDFSCTKNTFLSAGGTYPLSVTLNGTAANTEIFRAYIDWNNNGQFEDPSEFIGSGSQGAGSGTTTVNVIVPGGAVMNTPLRMRVYGESGDLSAAERTCAASLFVGDVEDYAVWVNSSGISVAPRVFLEGAYDPATGLMSDVLRSGSMLPSTQPYTAMGYSFTGFPGAGTTLGAGVLTVTGGNAIVDWVIVELRTAATPSTVAASCAALLQRDGDVVGLNGTSPVSFMVAPGNYHVAIRHRNHLGCMSSSAAALNASPITINFTTAATSTYGTAARKSVTGTFPAQVLWSGDVTFNHAIKYTGGSNDRDPILVRVGNTTPNNTVNGYWKEDVNLNGVVKYTGGGNDRDPILVNVGNTTPNNVRQEQLP